MCDRPPFLFYCPVGGGSKAQQTFHLNLSFRIQQRTCLGSPGLVDVPRVITSIVYIKWWRVSWNECAPRDSELTLILL